MSDIENQQATAVIDEVAPTTASFAPEVAVTTETTTAVPLRSLEEVLPDVIVTGFAPADTDIVDEKVFSPRESTNLIVNRRANPDGSHEFILSDQDDSWLIKNDTFVTGSPVGQELTQELLQLLVEETHSYFTVLDSDGDKTSLGDKGDMRNLTRLQAFVEDTPLLHLLTDGVRSINAGSRLLQKALSSNAKVINGAMTIAYQVPGHEGVMKYRLVGEINRELVVKVAQVAGSLLSDLKPAEPKQKKSKKEVVEGQAQGTPKQEAGVQTTEQTAKAPQRQPKATGGQDQQLAQLRTLVEALVVDNRDIKRALQTTQGLNQALRAELKSQRDINNQLLDDNKAILESLGTILETLTK